jgi:mannose-6-phosphate isomerase-like protein (cupin superfamily)
MGGAASTIEPAIPSEAIREDEMFRDVRRIVTGHRPDGRSCVMLDGPAGRVVGGEAARLSEIWVTDRMPAANSGNADAADRDVRLEPPAGGTIVRTFELAPHDPSVPKDVAEKAAAEMFAAIGAAHARVDTAKDAGMHKTKTVDYIILLSGRITLVLDDGEVELKPFDVVVQRGTNHSWINKGPDNAFLAAVLVDSEPGA